MFHTHVIRILLVQCVWVTCVYEFRVIARSPSFYRFVQETRSQIWVIMRNDAWCITGYTVYPVVIPTYTIRVPAKKRRRKGCLRVGRRPRQMIKPQRGKRSSSWFIGYPINMITVRLRDMAGLTCRAANFPKGWYRGPSYRELSPGPCNSPKVTNAFTDFVKRKAVLPPFNVRLIRDPGNFVRECPGDVCFSFYETGRTRKRVANRARH